MHTQLLNSKIPYLQATLLLKTTLSLFKMGEEISFKFFDGKISLGNYNDCLVYEGCEGLYVDYAGLRYMLVKHVDNNDLIIPNEFIFSVNSLPPMSNWTFDCWGKLVNISAFYGAQFVLLNLKETVVAYKDENDIFVTL
ncbi:MAG: hypothetical protein J6X44_00295 [Thermoguttaceae bacterium]|nr:hypothetical protein [Thermoguttaceae bacterium]